MGKKPTGRKPETVTRDSAKTDGAFGKETLDELNPGDATRNEDNSVRRSEKGRAGGRDGK
jgi:hypothetical protein